MVLCWALKMERTWYLHFVLYGMAAACGFGGVSSACDLSLRDQLLLIRTSEAVPTAGSIEVTSLAGEEVECASLGPFRIVQYHGGGMYVLDPQRAFNRWSRTGASFTGGASAGELKVSFYLYRRSDPLNLWREFGRGRFTEQELASLSVSDDTVLSWTKMRLLTGDRYRAAIAERTSPEEERTVRLLLVEKAGWYMADNEPTAVQVVDISPGEILKYSAKPLSQFRIDRGRGRSRRWFFGFLSTQPWHRMLGTRPRRKRISVTSEGRLLGVAFLRSRRRVT